MLQLDELMGKHVEILSAHDIPSPVELLTSNVAVAVDSNHNAVGKSLYILLLLLLLLFLLVSDPSSPATPPQLHHHQSSPSPLHAESHQHQSPHTPHDKCRALERRSVVIYMLSDTFKHDETSFT
jgi:hypothetical protein